MEGAPLKDDKLSGKNKTGGGSRVKAVGECCTTYCNINFDKLRLGKKKKRWKKKLLGQADGKKREKPKNAKRKGS